MKQKFTSIVWVAVLLLMPGILFAAGPAKPGTITQTPAGKICPGQTVTFSINAVTGAIGYTWTAPTGGNIVSGQGTTSVDIYFTSSFTANSPVKVSCFNGGGTSPAASKTAIKGAKPSMPSGMTGDAFGVCQLSGVPYSVTNVPGVTYTWAFDDANASISSGQGTNAITADFNPSFTNGLLTVSASNGCGTSVYAAKKVIKAIPAAPAAITGNAAVCAGATAVAYSVSPVASATSYTWGGPTGTHFSDGGAYTVKMMLTTSSPAVTVNYGSSGGFIKAKANNACGFSPPASLAVSMNCRTMEHAEVSFSLYPNPATDVLHVLFPAENDGSYGIRILNVVGKQVVVKQDRMNAGGNDIAVDISSLQPGFYHLIINGENKSYNKSFIVQ